MTKASKTIADLASLHELFCIKNVNSAPLLNKIRQTSFDNFVKLGLPNKKLEAWKYTDISKVFELNYHIPEKRDFLAAEVKKITDNFDGCYKIVLVNGFYHPEHSDIDGVDSRVIVQDLQQSFEDYSEILDRYYNKFSENKDALCQLNRAFAQGGIFLNIHRGVCVDKPIHIFNFYDGKEDSLINPSCLLIAGENSQSAFIESFHSLSANSRCLYNSVYEFDVKKAAHCSWIKMQDDADLAAQNNNTFITQDQDSTFKSFVFTLNGSWVRNNSSFQINGTYAHTDLYGLYLAGENNFIDNHTFVAHNKPECFSNEYYKGVVADKGTAVFNGKVYVKQDAQKTNAFQSDKNILLGSGSVINAKPELEIYADDVKCSHGATIGRLDDEALFYLQSRGISKEKSQQLLLEAFVMDVINKMENDNMKAYIQQACKEKLNSI